MLNSERFAFSRLLLGSSPTLWLFSIVFFTAVTVQIVAATWGLVMLAALCGIAMLGLALIATLQLGSLAALIVVPTYLFRNPVYFYSMAYADHSTQDAMQRFWLAAPDLFLGCILLILGGKYLTFGASRASVRAGGVALGLLILLAVSYLVSSAPVEPRMAYLRSFAIPIVILALAVLAARSEYKRVASFLLSNVMLALFFGAALYLTNNSGSWAAFGSPYFQFKHGGPLEGIPGIWQTTFFGFRFLRFGGTLLDPIAFGYWCVAGVTLALMLKRYAVAVLLMIGIVLSLSKGAYIALAIVILMPLWAGSKRRADIKALALVASIMAVVAVILFVDEGKGSFWVHLEGAQRGVLSAIENPAGAGMGHGGNWSGIVSGVAELSTGAESGIGVIAYQLGLVGLLVAGGFFLWQLYARRKWASSAPFQSSARNVVVALAVLLVLQENPLSASAAFPLWWIIGYTMPWQDAKSLAA